MYDITMVQINIMTKTEKLSMNKMFLSGFNYKVCKDILAWVQAKPNDLFDSW